MSPNLTFTGDQSEKLIFTQVSGIHVTPSFMNSENKFAY